MTDTQARLESIFRKILRNDKLSLTPELTAQDVENWDSLNHIQIVLRCQKEFGIKFTVSEVAQLKNVGALLELIDSKRQKTSP